MSSSLLSAAGRVGAARKWARTFDRSAATAKARSGLEAKFERQAREALATAGVPHPTAEQLAKSTAAHRQAHYAGMTLARLRARARKTGGAV